MHLHLAIWTNTLVNLDKCILQFEQIHVTLELGLRSKSSQMLGLSVMSPALRMTPIISEEDSEEDSDLPDLVNEGNHAGAMRRH